MWFLFLMPFSVGLQLPPSGYGSGVTPQGGPIVPLVGGSTPDIAKPTPREAQIASLHEAAVKGDVRSLRVILAADPTLVNQRPPFREGEKRVLDLSTPLHRAVAAGHAEAVRVLLEMKANPNAEGDDGWTPLHVAAKHGHAEIAALLLKTGADIRAKTRDIPEHPAPGQFNGGRRRFIPAKPARTAAEIAGEAGYRELEKMLSKADR